MSAVLKTEAKQLETTRKKRSFLKVFSLLNYKTSQHEQMLVIQDFDRKSGEYLIIARVLARGVYLHFQTK